VAILGSALIRINAVVAPASPAIRSAFKGVDKDGDRAGDKVGRAFSRGFARSAGDGGGRRGFLAGMFGPAFFARADAAREKFLSLTRTANVLGPTLAGLVAAIGSVVVGLGIFVSVLGSALPALIVLPAAILAVAQAFTVLKAAFSGVGKAISAGLNQAGSSSKKNFSAIYNAQRRVQDATQALAQVYEDVAERIDDANKRVVRSQRDLADAQRETAKAQQELVAAQEEAAESLQQLRFETEDAAISEAKARIEFEKSRESLQRIQDLPPNSRARREAELAFAEADLNLRRAIDRNSDLKKEEAAASRAGVQNSKVVLDAREKLSDAQRNEADAAEAVMEAQKDADKAVLDGAREIAKAQQAVADANRDLSLAYESSTAGADAYGDALKKLSPAAATFVRYMVDTFIPYLRTLRDIAAEEFFPKLIPAMERLRLNVLAPLEPYIANTASLLGDVVTELVGVAEKTENMDRLKSVWTTNDGLISDLGTTVGNLYETFLILLKAAEPLITAFGEWAKNLSESWKQSAIAGEKTGELTDAFLIAKGIISDLGKSLRNIWDGLKLIGKNAVGPGSGGQMLLDFLKESTGNFKDLMTQMDADGSLKTYLKDVAGNFIEILKVIGKITGGILGLADNEGIGIFAKKIGEAVDNFFLAAESLTSPEIATSFGDLITKVSELVAVFTKDTGGITTFFDTISFALDKVILFFESPLGQKIIGFLTPILGFASAFGVIYDAVLLPILSSVSLLGKLFGPLSGIFGGLGASIGSMLGPIAFIVLLLIGMWTQSEKFRDGVMKLVNTIRDHFIEQFEELKRTFEENKDEIEQLKNLLRIFGDFVGTYILPIIGALIGFLLDLSSAIIRKVIDSIFWLINILETVMTFFGNLGQAISDWWNGLIERTEKAGDDFRKTFSDMWDGITDALANVWPNIQKWWDDTTASTRKRLAEFADIFSGMWDGIGDALADAWAAVRRWWNSNIAGELFTINNPFNDDSYKVSIPKLAMGGVIQPTTGGTLALIGEAGRAERVEPLDAQGLSQRDRALISMLSGKEGGGASANGPVINVYPSQGMDERELAAIVSRELAFTLRRGGN
jgi:phage-related protein